MTVKQLIEKLEKCNPDLEVVIPVANDDGCETCGYGETYDNREPAVYDLETRVEIRGE